MKGVEYEGRGHYLSRKDSGEKIAVITPEGIPLHFVVAHTGDRAAGFLFDMIIQIVALFVLALLAFYAVGSGGEGFMRSWIGAFFMLAQFLLSMFYFTWFELRWQGSTPGKRWLGIRVTDRRGGPLTSDAVITRNLTRQLEVQLPLMVLLAPEALWPGAPGWARLVSLLWVAVFALMPMFNKQRLRVGDLVAGTMVVLAPKAVLLTDQSTGTAIERKSAEPSVYEFTPKQLDVYGIYELQVLEDVLRKSSDGQMNDLITLETVAEKIKVKIGWDRERWRVDNDRFLREFYAALRARLEHRMLLGERKEDKYSK